mmetsp:Transcript_51862/g.130289  ORF Transcript_51862/g.130289 Transcript_51862/m.130289 type:complete len:215 (+) Transcript_51862:255-899(+)
MHSHPFPSLSLSLSLPVRPYSRTHHMTSRNAMQCSQRRQGGNCSSNNALCSRSMDACVLVQKRGGLLPPSPPCVCVCVCELVSAGLEQAHDGRELHEAALDTHLPRGDRQSGRPGALDQISHQARRHAHLDVRAVVAVVVVELDHAPADVQAAHARTGGVVRPAELYRRNKAQRALGRKPDSQYVQRLSDVLDAIENLYFLFIFDFEADFALCL